MEMLNMDEASAALIVQLQMEDLETLVGKGKYREGEHQDTELAVDAYKAELETLGAFLLDQRMCRSVARAVLDDGEVVRQLQQLEDQESQDRALALSLGSNHKALPPAESAIPDSPLDEELLSKLGALYVCGPESEWGTQPESSSWAASRQPHALTKMETCVSCQETYRFYDVVGCPCSHKYCRGCLADLFKIAISDESLYPPRCCRQEIPLEKSRPFLSSRLVGEFLAKKLEMEDSNRTFCHEPGCSRYIPQQFVQGEVGTCPQCHSQTCTICKSGAHSGECPKDEAAQALLRLAAENEWQRCFECGRVVELETGCYHMTCRCKAQFCYKCGQKWKTCDCDQWGEHRLRDRATVVADRRAGGRLLDGIQRDAQIERMMRNLVANHECAHNTWRRLHGSHQCEECHHTLPEYIFECRRCNIMACRRCRYNRL